MVRRSLARRLATESAIFGLGGAANQILNFLLVPLYAAALGIAEYGVFAILNSMLALGSTLAGFALTQSFFRTFLRDAETEGDRRQALATALTLRLLVSGVAVTLFIVSAPFLTGGLFGDSRRLGVVLLLAPNIFLDTLNMIPLQFLRGTRRPGWFAAIVGVRAVASAVAIVVFVFPLEMGIFGAVLGGVVGSLAASVVAFPMLARFGGLSLQWNVPLMKSMLAFSAPLVPAAAAGWFLNLSDRWLLQLFEGSRVVGIYSLGYALGVAVNVFLIQPFLMTWAAAKWDVYRGAGAPRVYAEVTTAFITLSAFAALGLSALGTDAMRILFPAGADAGRFVIPFSAFAYVFLAGHTMAMTGLHVVSRTSVVGITMVLAAGVNLGLNLILIPALGFIGAGIATVLSYALLAVATAILSHHWYPVPWELRKLAIVVGLAAGLSAAAVMGPDHPLWRIACLLVYAPALMLLGAVPIQTLVNLLRSARRGRGSAA